MSQDQTAGNPGYQQNFDPQTGLPVQGQPQYPQQPYPQAGYPQPGGYPQHTGAYANFNMQPAEPSGAGAFFKWVFNFKLSGTGATKAVSFAYALAVFSILAFAIARLIDQISTSAGFFGFSQTALYGVWILLSNLVAVPLVTFAVLGIARLSTDALVAITNSKKDESQD